MKKHLGWPVVSAENCFDVISELGIMPWPEVTPPMPLDKYLVMADSKQVDEYERFGPKNNVVFHKNPSNDTLFTGFQSVFKPYSLVFALIDGMIPVTAEWKHGNGLITIVPVCGVPSKAEAGIDNMMDKMRAVGWREWEEETGTKLDSLVPLGPDEGIWSQVRNCTMRCFPFLGKIKEPIEKGSTKFDDNETLAMVLFPLEEWVKLMETPEPWNKHPKFGLEACTRDSTYAALRKMGKLQLI